MKKIFSTSVFVIAVAALFAQSSRVYTKHLQTTQKLQLKTITLTDFTTNFYNSDSLSNVKVPTAKAVADYIRLRPSSGGGGSSEKNKGIFYVSENYSGTAATVVSSLSNSGVSSLNSSYTSQLLSAKMGTIANPFPDPWTARNAALDSIGNGSISDATIFVIRGSFTVGSDVAANNGDTIGVSTNATIADIGFTSANSTTVASLMKNKINYEFAIGTEIIMINRTYAIHAGGYNVDASSIKFVSGIYGKGDFIIIYGNEQTPAVSQRFIQINNTRAVIVFEANKVVMQRAWLYIFSYEKIVFKANTFITDAQSNLLALNGVVDANAGNGMPMEITIEVDNVYQGYKYFPYPSIRTGANLYRPLISIDGNESTRPQFLNIRLKNVFQHTAQLSVLYNQFLTGVTRNISNWHMQLTVDYLQNETDSTLLALQTSFGSIIRTMGSNGNFIRNNVHEVFTIKKAVIDNALIMFTTSNAANAVNTNNSMILNSDYIFRKIRSTGALKYIFSFVVPQTSAAVSNALVGERPHVLINVGKAIAKQGVVFSDSGWNNGVTTVPVYIGSTQISGTFITEDGSPVIELSGTGNAATFKDCILIAKGSAVSSIIVNNGGNAVQIYTKNVLTNLPIGAGITQFGNYIIDTNILNYY